MNKATGKLVCYSVFAASLVSMTASALAVDGVVLIDQNKALAGGVTPGDTPGFPVVISQPGSYRLSSNLTVPDANTTAIQIAASHVTLDLNGFAILGPVNCAAFPCQGLGSVGSRFGGGVITSPQNTPRFNVTVRNGVVQGMGGLGVYLVGDANTVEHITVRSNGNFGILLSPSGDRSPSAVRYCIAERNVGGGISVSTGQVTHNVAARNDGFGIFVEFGTAAFNTSNGNSDYGLAILRGGYFGNVLADNGFAQQVFAEGGVNLGQNSCNTTVCPGAQF